METKMFCNQCQEAVGNKACTVVGMCGKNSEVSALQDVLLYVTTGLAKAASLLSKDDIKVSSDVPGMVTFNLFVTITNANFDDDAILNIILSTVKQKSKLLGMLKDKSNLGDVVTWTPLNKEEILLKAPKVNISAIENEDIRSLRSLVIYGLKGMAAYIEHARVLDSENSDIDTFIMSALTKTIDSSLSANELTALVLETGKYGVDAMALLDAANTKAYGNPKITSVKLGVGKNPAILISGHDLKDLEMLLEQTKGTGVDVYTHGEMLPAHYYPEFKKYDNLVGNYGNAWWKQKEEFEKFNGPILMTTNCIVPPRDSYKDKIYTTGAVGFPGCKHIEADNKGYKDFSQVIELAKKSLPPTELEQGEITGGFAHNQVMALADKVVDAVKSGHIKQFVVMAGCDGRAKSRNYYTEFAEALPKDTVILTAGCAKYRYNKLQLGDISGIPRVLDAGQCNDSYSLAVIALKLKEVFGLDDINKLPIIYNIAWYEQKAVIVLLALLHLGVKNIHLGPTLPAFLTPNTAKVLVDNFGISGIGSVEGDIKKFFGSDVVSGDKKINGSMIVGDILRIDRGLADILMGCGMHCLGCPSSQSESLSDACMVHGIDVDTVVDKLNAYLDNK